ncbi:MAG: RagB/SusD family nutrient uptake outer membrane protein [Paludibacteraceae bacterium]|nr:RagB/SusD family nutrient uptake outer membrane protein [Paludibacteraceae bacterium]
MKNIVKYLSLVCVAFGLASCVHNLNTTPIDPNSSTSFNPDRMFTKCYSCMAVIGQSGPGENSDVEDIDAGTSGFYRTIWYCNELTTDEAWWIWDDKESKQLCQTNWVGDNTMIRAIYTRLNLNIKYCNHYLTYASREPYYTGSAEDDNRLAEVRWIRAFHIFYLMDMYLYAPLITEESNEFPHFLPRHKIYEWLVEELKDLIVKLPAERVSKYRVGKAAAQLLLARVYLNADVYNKYNPYWTAGQTWDKALNAAKAVIADNPQHSLVTEKITTDSGFVYSAYQQLFMGDNHRDEVMKESLFQIYQDGLYAQSYASAMMLIGANRLQGMNAWGIEAEWHSMRTSPTMVDKFLKPMNIDRATASEMVYDEFKMPAQLHDDRAILSSDGLSTGYKFTLKGNQELGDTKYLFDCWAGLKFTGVYSSASLPELSPRQNKDWPDTDIPMLRLAEAYMIQAEANFRLGKVGDALDIINNTIRKRANADPLPSLDEETLLDEWSREFWYEGRRRIDLVRFDRFFGPKSDPKRYHWEGRMGKNDGSQFFTTGTEDYMNWFPVPSEDKKSNPNFKTDVEGDAGNAYASQGGDGYTY